jgi:hypothetical protein
LNPDSGPPRKPIAHITANALASLSTASWRTSLPEAAVAFDILVDYLRNPSSIVRAFAMQRLAALASTHSSVRAEILPLLEELTEIGAPAMRALGRNLLQHLNRQRAKA